MSVTRFDPELVEFLQSGVSILVGSCDTAGTPACLHGLGARVSSLDAEITVYLTLALAGLMLENFRQNPRIAVTFSRAVDHRSLQLKGRVTRVEASDDEAREVQERYLKEYGASLLALGFPADMPQRIAFWPSVAVTFRAENSFEQTPGPRAGSPLDV